MLQTFSGATVRSVLDRSGARVPEHAHDWPVLSLFVMGGFWNTSELGESFIAGPSAILYRAGAAHQNRIASDGFEQVEIEFDPCWLGGVLLPDAPVSHWLGGHAGAGSRNLAQLCRRDTAEERLCAAVRRFVENAGREPRRAPPDWIATVNRRLRKNSMLKAGDLARDVRRHPSWLGDAYRRTTGEGLRETAARLRVERAARLLRETDRPAASIAAEAGFCDQSHMSRTFQRVLGRVPSAVREDRRNFRQGGPSA
ncbi:MAG TPA: AraC family transcriptional regulator [Rhizomicrobium sp.]